MKFTHAQRRAIELDGRAPVLVSAAAGAGKTTVLTERIFVRLAEGKVRPSELLVLTFTERAAAEMKHRIVRRFEREIAGASGEARARLEAIAAALPEAEMSTIHAFCNRVVREFSAELVDGGGNVLLEPGYAVLDPDAADRLLGRAVEDVLTACYRLESRRRKAGRDSFSAPVPKTLPDHELRPFALLDDLDENAWLDRFLLTVRALAPGYGDGSLQSLILTMLATLRSLPFYETVLRASLADDREHGRFFAPEQMRARYEELKQDVRLALEDFALLDAEPYFLRAFDPKEKAKTIVQMADPLLRQREVLGAIAARFEGGGLPDWDELVELSGRLLPMRLPARSPRSKQIEEQDAFFELYGRRILPLVQLLSGTIRSKAALDRHAPGVEPIYTQTKAKIEADEAVTEAIQTCFAELTLLVDRRYRTLKIRRNAVDFSDFEHYALALLSRAEIAETLNGRYREIYLDEYQDTSSIQEAILERIDRAGRFMVGDVKQSIYRFRHANPSLFMARASAYRQPADGASGDDDAGGRLVLLNENFRSSRRILDSVNRIFSRLLCDERGEIVYDERHRLIAGLADKPDDAPVTLLFVEEAEKTDADRPGGDELADDVDPADGADDAYGLPQETPLYEETTVTVREIIGLLSAGRRPDEIAILGRTTAVCGAYYRALRRCRIPVSGVSQDFFHDSAEYRTLAALAAAVVNRRRDVELASLMLSDFLPRPFDENELLDMRLFAGRGTAFADAVSRYAESGPDERLRVEAARFLARLDEWADLAEELAVADWYRVVLQQSGYEDTVGRGADGRQRLGNVRLFLRRLDESAPKDLREFLDGEAGGRGRAGGPKSFTERTIVPGTVQILTMHAAKGLEFPVVFVVGLGSPWRLHFLPKLAFSEQHGLSSHMFDAGDTESKWSRKHTAAMAAQLSATRQEEWRLLYVAMTRAEEKLYLVVREPMGGGGSTLAGKVFDLIEGNAVSFDKAVECMYAHRLILAALALDDSKTLLDFLENGLDATSGDVVFERREPETEWPLLPVRYDDPPGADEAAPTVEAIVELLSAEPPRAKAAAAAAKLTVSEMKRRLDAVLAADGEIEEDPSALTRDLAYTVERPDRPDRNLAKALGTVLHTVFQFLDMNALRADPAEDTYRRQLELMVEKDRLLPEEAKQAVPFARAALDFAGSAIGERLADARTVAYREMPFTLSEPIRDLPGEITLIQGMIDLWFIAPDGEIWLIDFKSDTFGTNDPAVLRRLLTDRYAVQLSLYARAIEKAVGKKVNYSVVWLIRNGVAIDVSTDAAEGEATE